MSAPLTPPPSSATELMDQEKDAPAAGASGAATTAPPAIPVDPVPVAPAVDPAPLDAPPTPVEQGPDFYQKQLATLADFVAMGNWAELIRVAELADLHVVGDERTTRLSLIIPLVMAYLITDELPPARSVFTRLPESLVPIPLTQALFQLVSAVWARDYARTYARVDVLHQLAKASTFPDAQLGTVLIALLNAFLEAFRHRALALVSKAYLSIALSLAQTYFGLSSGEQVVTELTKRGWTYDPATQVLSHVPMAAVRALVVHDSLAAPSSLATFSFVTEAVARLEA